MPDKRPNILLIMTDQQRGDCLGGQYRRRGVRSDRRRISPPESRPGVDPDGADRLRARQLSGADGRPPREAGGRPVVRCLA